MPLNFPTLSGICTGENAFEIMPAGALPQDLSTRNLIENPLQMRTHLKIIAVTALLIFAASASDAFAQRRPQASQFGWSTNYRQALDTAKKSNKPVLLLFRCVP